MACETGNCPECKIRVGATNVTPVNYHLFIWYTDGEREIVYRGGPKNGSTYQTAVDAGRATLYEAPTKEGYDIDLPWGNLVTNRQEGLAGNYDYRAWRTKGRQDLMVTVAEGPNYCGLDERFTLETRRIGELGRTYNAIDIDRIDNSNATVYTILQEMGLPLVKPSVSAPGWGTNLHRERTAPERIQEIKREINRFENLPYIDQYNFMKRLFGGY
jgi:hypothetical protein